MPPTYAQNLGAQIQFDQGIGYSIPVPGNGLPSLVQPPQTPTQPISQPATQPAPQPPAQQQGQQAQPVQLNSIFSPHIGTRASQVNPTQLEYFNKQTGQGFSTEQQALTFASGLGAGQVTSLDQLQAPVNSQQSTNGQQIPSSDPNKQLAGVAGNAGLSVDDFLKLAQANSALTPEDIAAIRKSLGIDQASAAAFAPPAQSTVDLYNQAYGSAGLGDIKNQVKALSSQIAQQQNDYADAVASINENPFLDEASRVGRQNTLATQAQQKISNLQQE